MGKTDNNIKMKKHAHNFIDLTGKRFGRLTVLRFSHKDSLRKTFWECLCSCGNKTTVYSQKLKTGHTKSCGCLNTEVCTIHGESKTKFFVKWNSLKNRCGKKRNYEHVSVCKRWDTFLNFKKDMHQSYLDHVAIYGEKNTTIDRINNDKGYSPSNCRWSTYEEQNNNLRKNITVVYKGEKKTISNWYRHFSSKINKATFAGRVKRGWTVEEAAKIPLKYNYKK